MNKLITSLLLTVSLTATAVSTKPVDLGNKHKGAEYQLVKKGFLSTDASKACWYKNDHKTIIVPVKVINHGDRNFCPQSIVGA